MAKQTPTNENLNAVDEINEQLTSATEKVQKNQKVILWATLAVAILVAIVLAYVYLIHEPGKEKANDAIGRADLQLAIGNDSVALAQYKDVADNYGGDASNRAALQTACLLYKDGKYQEALDYLKKFSAGESIIGAAAYSLKGDCYVNLDELDKAVSAFKDAIKQSDDNPYYTPFFMMKLARVYAVQENYSGEAKLYKEILEKYPAYGANNRVDVDKLYKRAEARANQN